MIAIIIPILGGMAVGIALSGGSPYLLIPGFVLIILHGVREVAIENMVEYYIQQECDTPQP